MHRTVTADLDLQVDATATVVVQVAVARNPGLEIDDELRLDGAERLDRLVGDLGGVRDVLRLQPGHYRLGYRAQVSGRAEPPSGAFAARFDAGLPSRYAQSDVLMAPAQGLFAGRQGQDLLQSVRDWVHDGLDYVPGSSTVTDGAVDTYLARQGVCRDYTHLTSALLRSLEVPARLVACYAPGLTPMDFHAVVEAWVDERWQVVDPTGLAPRGTLLRICTGRDAADTSFMTTLGGLVTLSSMQVTAVVDGDLPGDDQVTPVVMA